MANKKRNVTFSPDRLEDALHARECSLNQLAKDGPPWNGQKVYAEIRTIRRCKQYRRISPELLEEISVALDIEVDYLKGKYDWPLKDMDETMRRMYRKYYLNPKNFPRNRIYPSREAYLLFIRTALESHGVAWETYLDASQETRERLAHRLDFITWRLIQSVFPHARYADDEASYGRDGTPWNSINEVIGYLVNAMEDDELDAAGVKIS